MWLAAVLAVVPEGLAVRTVVVVSLVAPTLSVAEVRASLRVDHDNSFWSWAENEFSAKWGVSIPMTLGETPASAVAKADIIYISIIEVRVKWPYKDCYKA